MTVDIRRQAIRHLLASSAFPPEAARIIREIATTASEFGQENVEHSTRGWSVHVDPRQLRDSVNLHRKLTKVLQDAGWANWADDWGPVAIEGSFRPKVIHLQLTDLWRGGFHMTVPNEFAGDLFSGVRRPTRRAALHPKVTAEPTRFGGIDVYVGPLRTASEVRNLPTDLTEQLSNQCRKAMMDVTGLPRDLVHHGLAEMVGSGRLTVRNGSVFLLYRIDSVSTGEAYSEKPVDPKTLKAIADAMSR